MTRLEFEDRLAYCKREYEFLQTVQTNCTRCQHYSIGAVCAKHGQIPPDFVQQGCDEWEFDDVPF